MKKKPETARDKWKKRWFIGTPFGGNDVPVNPEQMVGMDDVPMVGMDGEPIISMGQ